MLGSEILLAMGNQYRQGLVHEGLARLARTRFHVGSIPGGTWRTYAATSEDGLEIRLSPKLATMPADVRRGIVMHEIGHAVDFLYPGQIVMGRGKLRGDLVIHADNAERRELAKWKRRDHDTVERFADAIAERAFGVEIGYRGPCLLQSVAQGVRPRPRGLR